MLASDRARKIAVMLVKVSVHVRRREFRTKLEGLAMDLVTGVALSDIPEVAGTAKAVKGMLDFGKVIYEIEPMNAVMISEECDGLVESLGKESDFKDSEQKQVIKAKDVSAGISVSTKAPKLIIDVGQQVSKPGKEIAKLFSKNFNKSALDIIGNRIAELPNRQEAFGEENPAIRQSAIIDRIKEFGNRQIQLKDIVAALPGVSERTVRYDIQRLCNQGVLERVGAGGPGTHYRLRNL
jgi:hypothetical protein